jgi:hypothetical protein
MKIIIDIQRGKRRKNDLRELVVLLHIKKNKIKDKIIIFFEFINSLIDCITYIIKWLRQTIKRDVK